MSEDGKASVEEDDAILPDDTVVSSIEMRRQPEEGDVDDHSSSRGMLTFQKRMGFSMCPSSAESGERRAERLVRLVWEV